MLGLPTSTEIHKVLTKKKVFEHFGASMSAERRKRFDADIARMTLVQEISPVSLNLEAGEAVQSLFVMHVLLRTAEFDPQSIAYLSRMFGQKLVLLLEADNRQRLALWQTRLLMTQWAAAGSLTLPLSGLNLDTVWENIVSRIAGIERAQGQTRDEQLAAAVQREKLQKEIARLERLARAERQPKKKFELVQQIRMLQQQLGFL